MEQTTDWRNEPLPEPLFVADDGQRLSTYGDLLGATQSNCDIDIRRDGPDYLINWTDTTPDLLLRAVRLLPRDARRTPHVRRVSAGRLGRDGGGAPTVALGPGRRGNGLYGDGGGR